MPFYAAISTDIKKSSSLWNNLPTWMFQAVQRTNNITEFVVNQMKSTGIHQEILPNSPEGDAYTILFTSNEQEKMKNHVLNVAHALQQSYKKGREKGILKANQEDIEDNIGNVYKSNKTLHDATLALVNMTEFFHAIFVRVGVAFSNEAPLKYTYKIHSYGNMGNEYDEKELSSFRGGVIDDSERAEANATKYKNAISVTQKGGPIFTEETTDKNSSFLREKEEITNLALADVVSKRISLIAKPVTGAMMFIHFHFSLSDVKDPHLYKAMQDEFNEVHRETLQFFRNQFPRKTHLVKVKRSADAMIYIENTVSKSILWNHSLELCSRLPEGSSIGICFTENVPREEWKAALQQTHPVGRGTIEYKFDYFGKCVNLAARMSHHSWSYEKGGLFKTLENNHACRVAMCSADNTASDGWSGWAQSKPGESKSRYNTPFEIEDIPMSALNAGGSERIRVISAHVTFGDVIHIGDTVEFQSEVLRNNIESGTVIRLFPLKAIIKLKDGSRKTKFLSKVSKVKENELDPITDLLKNTSIKGGLKSIKF